MLTAFFEKAGEGLAGKWLERLFGPAFLFWAGGLLIAIRPARLPAVWERLAAMPPVTQAGLLLAAALLLVASSALMELLHLPILRLLEGYWPPPFDRLGGLLIRWKQKRLRRQRQRWSELELKQRAGALSPLERQELARLEARRARTPRDLEDIQPTALGDILRAAETRPYQRYGLEPVLLWPRLWLLLPEGVQEEISAARQRLDRLAESWAWGLLFLLWGLAWPWAVPIALAWMALAGILLRQSAALFADLLVATFDTQRWRLYEALRWPLPEETGQAEVARGLALTRFIQRGMTDGAVRYQQPQG